MKMCAVLRMEAHRLILGFTRLLPFEDKFRHQKQLKIHHDELALAVTAGKG